LKRVILILCTLLLAAAFVFQFLDVLREIPQPVQRARIAALVPSRLAGWEVKDERLGQTEILNEAVLRTLNLDDYVYRRFTRGGGSFTVYAAYWARGRMPTRLVASHTPDRCWTENGMRCVDMRFRQIYQLGGQELLPAEYRAFTPPNDTEKTYVAYWHTVEGKIYDYGARFNAMPHPWLWGKDIFAQAAYGSREQLFVRIASSMPLEQLWSDSDFQVVMTKIADLGLWRPAEKPAVIR
jgi:hypothetical protein